MTTTYRAEKDGVEVFAKTTETYESTSVFPAELLNPAEGTVILYIDDDIVGVQRPYSERAAEDAARAVVAEAERRTKDKN